MPARAACPHRGRGPRRFWGRALPRAPDLAGRSRTQARPDGLPDCLNHERFSGRNSERRLLASKKWSRHDADTFEMDRGGWGCGRCSGEHELIARATKDPRWLDHSGRGIEILDDAARTRIDANPIP